MKEEKKNEDIIDIDNIIQDEELKEENIINEDNPIYNYNIIKKIINSKMENKNCKLKIEINGVQITGSGFFCHIPS